ncbi:MAG TPA: 4-hydroxybenzoate octaprenyltransferase [Rhodanobacteraceae bacterium]|nr:4-hydroxybenzoate octaprenyltransferase [Rhodanobacteraceae bacterium]
MLDWLLAYLPPRQRERARDLLVLIRMDRPIGALLLLWPTWWALWLAAKGFPPLKLLVVFTLGVFVMRSAGCAINDFADRKLDPKVQRTAGRPLAAGRVTPRDALVVFVVLLLVALGLVFLTNPLTIKLSLVGAALALLYPFAKRVTHLAQVVLGAAFGWGIPMAFAAVTNGVPPLAWLLFLANVLFSVIYDTEYAMVDREEDIKAGSKSTAILFGDDDLMVLSVLVASFLLAMAFVGLRGNLHWLYWPAWLVAAGLLLRQLWTMRDRSREHCFAAFRNNNWVGGVLWLGIVAALALA